MAPIEILAASTAWTLNAIVMKPFTMFLLTLGTFHIDRVLPFYYSALLWSRECVDWMVSLPYRVIEFRDAATEKVWNHRDVVTMSIFALYLAYMHLPEFIRRVRAHMCPRQRGFIPEKVFSWSPLESKAIQPSFQAAIYTDRLGDDTLQIKGQCFRHKNFLMTVAHVVENTTRARVVATRFMHGEFVDFELEIDTARFRVFDVDMAVVELTPGEWSKLNMTKCKVATSIPAHGVMAKVVANGQQSYGMVKQHETFGMLKYDGSTRGGFSGAPYHSNSTVYGVHAGADYLNVGFDITYINAIMRELPYHPEDSADYLERMIQRFNGEFEWEPSPVSPGEFRVRVGGSYHIIDSETLDEVQAKVGKKGRYVEDLRDYDEEAMSETDSFLENYPEEKEDFPRVPAARLEEELPPVKRGQVTYE